MEAVVVVDITPARNPQSYTASIVALTKEDRLTSLPSPRCLYGSASFRLKSKSILAKPAALASKLLSLGKCDSLRDEIRRPKRWVSRPSAHPTAAIFTHNRDAHTTVLAAAMVRLIQRE